MNLQDSRPWGVFKMKSRKMTIEEGLWNDRLIYDASQIRWKKPDAVQSQNHC